MGWCCFKDRSSAGATPVASMLLSGVVPQQACRDVLNLVYASYQFVTLSLIFIEPEQNKVGYEITGYEVTVVKYHH